MADQQQNDIADTSAAPVRQARQNVNRAAENFTGAAEQQSDQAGQSIERGADDARRIGEAGLENVRNAARSTADASRELAETGRRAGRDVAEAWRSALDPVGAIQIDMTRWFDEMWRHTAGFRPFSTLHAARPFAGLSAAPLLGLPAADVRETEEAYVLAVELPGLTREAVDLTVSGDALTIRGHKAEDIENGAGAYRISERRFGHFERSFPIPADVERDHIEASFHDGLLNVKLPKTEGAARHVEKIAISG